MRKDNRTWDNPDFRKYKFNNISALRAMFIIYLNDGDVASDDPEMKKVLNILDNDLFFKEFLTNDTKLQNGKPLLAKLKNFVKAMPKIKEDPTMNHQISSILKTFNSDWFNYNDCRQIYTDREGYPVFFDAEAFMDTFLEKDGAVHKMNEEDYQSNLILAAQFRGELENELIEKKKENNNIGPEAS